MSFCSQQPFPVLNCTSSCLGSATIFGEKKATCVDNGTQPECQCIRPYFQNQSSDECSSVLYFIGLEWILPMLTLEAIFKIYNIIYAVWIFRQKGLCCILAVEVARLVAQAMDPYYYFEAVPNGIAYVLNYISYALLISALCFIFLVFHALVNPQSSGNETIRERKWPKILVIILTIGGVTANLSRHIVILVVRASGGEHYEHILDSAFNGMNLVVLLFSLVLMTVSARCLQLRLQDIEQTTVEDREYEANAIAVVENIRAVINRYFYPVMGLGFVALVIFLLYSVCLGNMGPWIYFLSWAAINIVQSITTLFMLFYLEGKAVPSIPFKEEASSCCSCSCTCPDVKKELELTAI